MILEIDTVPDGAILNEHIKNTDGTVVLEAGSIVGRDTIMYGILNDYEMLDVSFCVPDSIVKKLNVGHMSNTLFMMLKNASMEDKQALASMAVFQSLDGKELELMNRLKLYSYETYAHAMTVAQHTVLLCTELKVPQNIMSRMLLGAVLHDVGKLKVSKDILHKRGKFTSEERKAMELHPEYGLDILSEYDISDSIVEDIVVHHHENWSGSGYPHKLKHSDISREAMIVHIADVYSALNMRRSYKSATERNRVWEIMMKETGDKFSPSLMYSIKDKLPIYFAGELIHVGSGLYAKMIGTNKDVFNPTVYFNGRFMFLKDAFALVPSMDDKYIYSEKEAV